jgi:dTDP-4-amino-4,6-dideoxygalactose transaminase
MTPPNSAANNTAYNNETRPLIPFNKAFIAGKELHYISQAVVLHNQLAGGGVFTQRCHALLEELFNINKVLLTHSCTAALEISALLMRETWGSDQSPELNAIMPAYTFVSTANAFLLRDIKPKFCDIREDTLNLDEAMALSLVDSNSCAIVPVHYAGVSCDLDQLFEATENTDVAIIEDAAQGVNAKYRGRFLGSIGDLGSYSFHETKNIISGEGGALLINNPKYKSRAEHIREKGTNRTEFFQGETDKYTWVDLGSSYLPSELVAAFLYAQLENIQLIHERRRSIYETYEVRLKILAHKGVAICPRIPEYNESSYHIFHLLCNNEIDRNGLIAHLKKNNIHALFHYIPLHSSPMGQKLGYKQGQLPVSESVAERIVRLPFFFELKLDEQDFVCDKIYEYFGI